jgi:hypothetical protein
MNMLDTMREIVIRQAAMTAHEVNRVFCAQAGDLSHKPWHETTVELQDSVISGVRKIFNGEVTTPEESHQSWLDYKAAEGYVYGSEKDTVAKTHPCFLPYEELPEHDKLKDTYFFAVVMSFTDRAAPIPTEETDDAES